MAPEPTRRLVVRDLRKNFGGTHALDGVDFDADSGSIHAILGENGAGKSTLVKCITGLVVPDSGSILVDGAPYTSTQPAQALQAGVAWVTQEIALIPDLSVAGNLLLRREPRSWLGSVSHRRTVAAAQAILEECGLEIDVKAPASSLTLAQQQMVELARAVSLKPRILVLDEATSALGTAQVETLMRIARQEAARGALVLFISHRLGEVRALCDRMTIMRNGAVVGNHDVGAIDDEALVLEMLGRRPSALFPPPGRAPRDHIVLKCEGIRHGRVLKDVSLELREGEILGLAGLDGQGQAELLQSLVGAVGFEGRVARSGEAVRIRNPKQALAAGIVLVPEDRKSQGLLLSKSIRMNITLSSLARITTAGFINRRRESSVVSDAMQQLQVIARDARQAAGELSGGNQQKVVLARALLSEARVVLLFDPTRGVDVGTKAEIFRLMRALADDGYSFIFYSSEALEVVRMSDRALVISEGRVAGQLSGTELTEEGILRIAIGAAA